VIVAPKIILGQFLDVLGNLRRFEIVWLYVWGLRNDPKLVLECTRI
jgi:hypothetical protein